MSVSDTAVSMAATWSHGACAPGCRNSRNKASHNSSWLTSLMADMMLKIPVEETKMSISDLTVSMATSSTPVGRRKGHIRQPTRERQNQRRVRVQTLPTSQYPHTNAVPWS